MRTVGLNMMRSSLTGLIQMAALAGACLLGVNAQAGIDARAPEVPDALKVPEGHKVRFHTYAVGAQIYVWTINPTNGAGSWVFKAPDAVLLDSDGNPVGIHYGGPTWESESGSKVVAARTNGVTVSASAIPWLLLVKVSSAGPGIFADVTYIHRVNTVGGLAPTTPGSAAGEEARVPYLAEYYFYRKQ